MKPKAILRDTDALRQARRYHPPANRSERSSRSENRPQSHPQTRRNVAAPEKKQQRQQEHGAGQSRQQTVRPFPPVNRLESVKIHAAAELAVLRDGLVLGELGLPFSLRKRRQNASDRLPFDD